MPKNTTPTIDVKPPQTIDLFLPYAQCASYLAAVIATFVLGGWGWWSAYYIKQEKDIAEYTLRDLIQKTTQTPHILSKLTLTTLGTGTGPTTIQVKVNLSNQGTTEARVSLDDHALTLTPFMYSKGMPVFGHEIPLGSTRFSGTYRRVEDWIAIGVNESYELSYTFQIDEPGNYLLRFLAKKTDDLASESKLGRDHFTKTTFSVGSDEYITIPKLEKSDPPPHI